MKINLFPLHDFFLKSADLESISVLMCRKKQFHPKDSTPLTKLNVPVTDVREFL